MLRQCAGGENGTPAAEVLLVRRAKAPALGMWTVPGGSLELGEQQDVTSSLCGAQTSHLAHRHSDARLSRTELRRPV